MFQKWEPEDLNHRLAFATEDFEIVLLSQIRGLMEMNYSKEESYRKCAKYYHDNCPDASWDDLAFKIYRSEFCTRQHQALEYMMEQSFISPKGKTWNTSRKYTNKAEYYNYSHAGIFLKLI